MPRSLAKIEAQKRYRAKNYEKHKEKTKAYMDKYLTKKFNEMDAEDVAFRMFRKMFK